MVPASMSPRLTVRTPRECSPEELKAFVSLASIGGEVRAADIERGVNNAKHLLWIDDGEIEPCAVAALKHPFANYHRSIFKKAGSLLLAADYPLEFGYAFTDESCRRSGHGRSLLRKALCLAQPQGVYATVRSDNEAMQSILEEHGFKRSGHEWPSTKRHATLILFVKAGATLRLTPVTSHEL